MYQDMLDELNTIEDPQAREVIAAEIMSIADAELEKDAGLIKGLALAAKPLWKANIKVLDSIFNPAKAGKLGVAIGAGATALGGKEGVANTLTGGMYGAGKNAIKELKTTGAQTAADTAAIAKIPKQASEADDLYKVAEDTVNSQRDIATKQIIESAGLLLLGGAAGYGAVRGGSHVLADLADNPYVARGVDVAVGKAGKEVVKGVTKGKLVAGALGDAAIGAGKMLGNANRQRTNFNNLGTGPSVAQQVGTVGAFGAGLVGASMAEEYLAGKVKDEYANLFDKKADIYGDIYDIDSIVKEANFDRLLGAHVVKPTILTTTFFVPMAAISAAAGRNLYGGMEPIGRNRPNNTDDLIIDVPTAALMSKKKNVVIEDPLVKSAMFAASTRRYAREFAEGVEDTSSKVPLEDIDDATISHDGNKYKKKIDDFVAKLSDKNPLKRLDALLVRGAEGYSGRKGLGHFLLEEVPYKSVESMAYAIPLTTVGLATGRNLKRGFEPIEGSQTDTAPPPAPGMTRLVVQTQPKEIL